MGLVADRDLCGFIALLREDSKGRRSQGRVSAPQPTFVLRLESPWYQYLGLPTLSSREPIDRRIVPVTRSLASCFWFSRYGNDYPGTSCALSSLRRVMCNELDQQVRQVAQLSTEGVVDLLCAGVGRDLGR